MFCAKFRIGGLLLNTSYYQYYRNVIAKPIKKNIGFFKALAALYLEKYFLYLGWLV